jgi:hypothetical protein
MKMSYTHTGTNPDKAKVQIFSDDRLRAFHSSVGGKSSSPIETRPTLNTNTTNNRNSRLHYRAFRDQGKHKYFPTKLFLPIPNYYTVVQRKKHF